MWVNKYIDNNQYFKSCFKVKPHGNDRYTLQRLMELYGGCVKLDVHLFPDEYWYYTNCEESILNNSSLIDLLETR